MKLNLLNILSPSKKGAAVKSESRDIGKAFGNILDTLLTRFSGKKAAAGKADNAVIKGGGSRQKPVVSEAVKSLFGEDSFPDEMVKLTSSLKVKNKSAAQELSVTGEKLAKVSQTGTGPNTGNNGTDVNKTVTEKSESVSSIGKNHTSAEGKKTAPDTEIPITKTGKGTTEEKAVKNNKTPDPIKTPEPGTDKTSLGKQKTEIIEDQEVSKEIKSSSENKQGNVKKPSAVTGNKSASQTGSTAETEIKSASGNTKDIPSQTSQTDEPANRSKNTFASTAKKTADKNENRTATKDGPKKAADTTPHDEIKNREKAGPAVESSNKVTTNEKPQTGKSKHTSFTDKVTSADNSTKEKPASEKSVTDKPISGTVKENLKTAYTGSENTIRPEKSGKNNDAANKDAGLENNKTSAKTGAKNKTVSGSMDMPGLSGKADKESDKPNAYEVPVRTSRQTVQEDPSGSKKNTAEIKPDPAKTPENKTGNSGKNITEVPVSRKTAQPEKSDIPEPAKSELKSIDNKNSETEKVKSGRVSQNDKSVVSGNERIVDSDKGSEKNETSATGNSASEKAETNTAKQKAEHNPIVKTGNAGKADLPSTSVGENKSNPRDTVTGLEISESANKKVAREPVKAANEPSNAGAKEEGDTSVNGKTTKTPGPEKNKTSERPGNTSEAKTEKIKEAPAGEKIPQAQDNSLSAKGQKTDNLSEPAENETKTTTKSPGDIPVLKVKKDIPEITVPAGKEKAGKEDISTVSKEKPVSDSKENTTPKSTEKETLKSSVTGISKNETDEETSNQVRNKKTTPELLKDNKTEPAKSGEDSAAPGNERQAPSGKISGAGNETPAKSSAGENETVDTESKHNSGKSENTVSKSRIPEKKDEVTVRVKTDNTIIADKTIPVEENTRNKKTVKADNGNSLSDEKKINLENETEKPIVTGNKKEPGYSEKNNESAASKEKPVSVAESKIKKNTAVDTNTTDTGKNKGQTTTSVTDKIKLTPDNNPSPDKRIIENFAPKEEGRKPAASKIQAQETTGIKTGTNEINARKGTEFIPDNDLPETTGFRINKSNPYSWINSGETVKKGVPDNTASEVSKPAETNNLKLSTEEIPVETTVKGTPVGQGKTVNEIYSGKDEPIENISSANKKNADTSQKNNEPAVKTGKVITETDNTDNIEKTARPFIGKETGKGTVSENKIESTEVKYPGKDQKSNNVDTPVIKTAGGSEDNSSLLKNIVQNIPFTGKEKQTKTTGVIENKSDSPTEVADHLYVKDQNPAKNHKPAQETGNEILTTEKPDVAADGKSSRVPDNENKYPGQTLKPEKEISGTGKVAVDSASDNSQKNTGTVSQPENDREVAQKKDKSAPVEIADTPRKQVVDKNAADAGEAKNENKNMPFGKGNENIKVPVTVIGDSENSEHKIIRGVTNESSGKSGEPVDNQKMVDPEKVAVNPDSIKNIADPKESEQVQVEKRPANPIPTSANTTEKDQEKIPGNAASEKVISGKSGIKAENTSYSLPEKDIKNDPFIDKKITYSATKPADIKGETKAPSGQVNENKTVIKTAADIKVEVNKPIAVNDTPDSAGEVTEQPVKLRSDLPGKNMNEGTENKFNGEPQKEKPVISEAVPNKTGDVKPEPSQKNGKATSLNNNISVEKSSEPVTDTKSEKEIITKSAEIADKNFGKDVKPAQETEKKVHITSESAVSAKQAGNTKYDNTSVKGADRVDIPANEIEPAKNGITTDSNQKPEPGTKITGRETGSEDVHKGISSSTVGPERKEIPVESDNKGNNNIARQEINKPVKENLSPKEITVENKPAGENNRLSSSGQKQVSGFGKQPGNRQTQNPGGETSILKDISSEKKPGNAGKIPVSTDHKPVGVADKKSENIQNSTGNNPDEKIKVTAASSDTGITAHKEIKKDVVPGNIKSQSAETEEPAKKFIIDQQPAARETEKSANIAADKEVLSNRGKSDKQAGAEKVNTSVPGRKQEVKEAAQPVSVSSTDRDKTPDTVSAKSVSPDTKPKEELKPAPSPDKNRVAEPGKEQGNAKPEKNIEFSVKDNSPNKPVNTDTTVRETENTNQPVKNINANSHSNESKPEAIIRETKPEVKNTVKPMDVKAEDRPDKKYPAAEPVKTEEIKNSGKPAFKTESPEIPAKTNGQNSPEENVVIKVRESADNKEPNSQTADNRQVNTSENKKAEGHATSPESVKTRDVNTVKETEKTGQVNLKDEGKGLEQKAAERNFSETKEEPVKDNRVKLSDTETNRSSSDRNIHSDNKEAGGKKTNDIYPEKPVPVNEKAAKAEIKPVADLRVKPENTETKNDKQPVVQPEKPVTDKNIKQEISSKEQQNDTKSEYKQSGLSGDSGSNSEKQDTNRNNRENMDRTAVKETNTRTEMRPENRETTAPKVNTRQVIDKITSMVRQGGSRFITLRLNPQGMGEIRISLKYNRNSVDIRMEVEKESVKHGLYSDTGTLAGNLLKEGFMLNDFKVMVGGHNFGRTPQNSEGSQEKKRGGDKQDNDTKTDRLKKEEPYRTTKNLGYNTYEILV